MSKFKIPKRIELSKLGSVYKDSYIELESPSFNRVKSFSDIKVDSKDLGKAGETMLSILGELFIGGKLPGASGLVDVAKEDLPELPLEVINECFKQLVSNDMRETNPNS